MARNLLTSRSMLLRRNQQLNRVLSGSVCIVAVLAGGMAWAAPELKVIAQEQPAHPLQVYRIVCEVAWTGDPAEYAILPATVGTIDWGTVAVTKVTARVRDGSNVVSQTVEIVPRKRGEFKTPEIKIAYLRPEDISPPETEATRTDPSARDPSPTLTADPFPLRVHPDTPLAWVSGILGASLLFFGGLGWWLWQRKRKPQPGGGPVPEAVPVDLAEAERALLAARQRRIDGEYYEFYLELTRAAQVLSTGATDAEAAARLQARAHEAGYRGVRPTQDEMDSDYRAMERALKQMKERDAG